MNNFFYKERKEKSKRMMASLFAIPIEVIREPQEGRYYYVTEYNEQIGDVYFTTNGLKYVGKYTGTRIDGWGKNMQELSYFTNDDGEEVIVRHTEKTAFYQVKHLPKALPVPAPAIWQQVNTNAITKTCMACQQVGHRIHTCPNESKRQAYYDAQIKELLVLRTPIVGKYYEATFWYKREGHWPSEKHYAKETTPREYVGQYLRHRQEGYGDGADHWAIFLRDDQEIEIEYDYDGKRAWYEVEKK